MLPPPFASASFQSAAFLEPLFSDLGAFYNSLTQAYFTLLFLCSRNVQITCPLNSASTDHKAFPQKLAQPCTLLPVLSKWAESCSQASRQTKNIFWSSIFWFIQLHYRAGLKKKKLKPTEEQNTSPEKTVPNHMSSAPQGRKEAGPSLSRPSSSLDSHLLFFCYFNFTTSKWGGNRLIVSMSLDCDQRHTKQFQNLQQPQI